MLCMSTSVNCLLRGNICILTYFLAKTITYMISVVNKHEIIIKVCNKT